MHTLWKKSSDKSSQCIKKERHHCADKVLYSQSYGFSRSDVWMWELDIKEDWVSKNWCFQIMVLEKIPRVAETARRSNQLIPGKINPKIHWKNWCWSWSSTLATWCVVPTHWERLWCWGKLKTKRRGQQRMRWLDSITDSMSLSKHESEQTPGDSGEPARGTQHAAAHGTADSGTWLSDLITSCISLWLIRKEKSNHFSLLSYTYLPWRRQWYFPPHSSILAWRIPWTEEPGGLQSKGSQRVRHNWATYHSLVLTHLCFLPSFFHSSLFSTFFFSALTFW